MAKPKKTLEERVESVEKFRERVIGIGTVVVALNIGAWIIFQWQSTTATGNAEEIEKLKEKAVVALEKTETIAKAASEKNEKLRQIDETAIQQKFTNAENTYEEMFKDLQIEKAGYEQKSKNLKNIEDRHKAMIDQLENGVEFQIVATDRNTTADYLAGKIIITEIGPDTTLGRDKKASVQKFILTFDKSTKLKLLRGKE